MKVYMISLLKTINKNMMRIVIMTAVMILGVGLSTGLGAIAGQLSDTFNDEFKVTDTPDIIIKQTSINGITQDLIERIESMAEIKDVDAIFERDNMYHQKIIMRNLGNQSLSKLTLIEGRMPLSATEVLVEDASMFIKKRQLHDTIEIDGQTLDIVGIVRSPLLAYKGKIPSQFDLDHAIETVVYFEQSLSTNQFKTDIYVKVDHDLDVFSKAYDEKIDEVVARIKGIIQQDDYVYLTHDDGMITPMVVQENINKMQVISLIFPIFFVLVIIIVVLTTMTRMIEDDRQIAGTYLSIGISKFKIKLRYYLIALLASILGSVIGLFLGYYTLAKLVYDAFGALIVLPSVSTGMHLELGIIVAVLLIMAVMMTVIVISHKVFKEKPAALLRPKVPKAGAKVFLEYIPFIWKRLSFKYKSSFRNILRYPLHFMMTVVSILGSTMLLFAGFGLYQNTETVEADSVASIQLIALIIIISAAALSILVTYNLTNMNIEERRREIATLKVLGYKKSEVSGYIFREVLIMACLGIMLGLPTGFWFVDLVFEYIDFGSVGNIGWYIWLLTPIISFAFVGITDILLVPKINIIDMNTSLKAIE